MADIWAWVKKWAWAIVLALISMLALGRKPSWVREKEREIRDRDMDINAGTEEASDVATTYMEVMEKHDDAIEQAQSGESRPSFTDSDSAASFVDDILDKRK